MNLNSGVLGVLECSQPTRVMPIISLLMRVGLHLAPPSLPTKRINLPVDQNTCLTSLRHAASQVVHQRIRTFRSH